MPFIQISMFKGRSAAQKKAIAKGISQVMETEAGVKPEHLWLRFADTELEDWFTGPDSAAEIRAKSHD